MKLILTSSGFADEVTKEKIMSALGKPLDKCKVLFIPSAIVLPTRRGKFFSMMKKVGFLRENIYVFQEDKPEEYTSLDIDLIYVCGGNTFLLCERIKSVGFRAALLRYLENGVVYVGASAGVHLLCPSTEHLLPFDENITNTTDFTALGIIDRIYFCHFCPEREKYYEQAKNEGKYTVCKLGNEDIDILEI